MLVRWDQGWAKADTDNTLFFSSNVANIGGEVSPPQTITKEEGKTDRNVSVLHQDEGGIGKSIPDAQKISRDPRDFPRAKPEGNLKVQGKSGGQRGWISQYLPSFGGARTISQHQFFYRKWIRKSFPVDREGLTVLKSILPC